MYETYFRSIEKLESSISQEDRSYMKTDHDRRFFLDRTQRLFDRIDHPERDLKFIHIAGTSGKGSTAMMLYQTMVAAGYNVGLYLTPYVTTAIENIHCNGKLIAPEDFAAEVEYIFPFVDQIHAQDEEHVPSYAEIFFAMAMHYFKQQNVEWVVLETGCGGRYDKTNIIPSPEITIITNIGYDHTKVLGDTLNDIAFHKAGIMKPDTVVFSAETTPSVCAVFDQEAERYNIPITYIQPTRDYDTTMIGPHQQWNAALCAAAAQHLGIAETHIEHGVKTARLPGRVEIMQKQPTVIIDGAHSPAKIEALVHTLKTLPKFDAIHLLFAAKDTKEPADLLAPLIPHIDTATCTSFTLPGLQSCDPVVAANTAHQISPSIEITVLQDAEQALEVSMERLSSNDLLIITGSLYLAGEVRKFWYPETAILEYQDAFPTQEK